MKFVVISEAVYKNGEIKKVGVISSTTHAALKKTKLLLGNPEKMEYELHLIECAEYIEYPSDEI